MSADRKPMLAKLHIAKKDLGLSDEAYADVLLRVTGLESARTLTVPQLHAALAEMKRLGWKGAAGPRSQKASVRLIYALWAEMKPFLADHSKDALRAFVRRQTRSRLHPDGVDAPEFLDAKQANLVIEALKAWNTRKRLERRADEAAQMDAGGAA